MPSRKTTYLLATVFLVPILLGLFAYQFAPNWFSQKTMNYGTLITPLIKFDANALSYYQDPKIEPNKWILMYIADNCAERCLQTLKEMETVDILLNEHSPRLQRLLITQQPPPPALGNVSMARPIPNLTDQLETVAPDSVFVIDPLGYIMMYYPPQQRQIPKIVKDLKRLLKYSRIG